LICSAIDLNSKKRPNLRPNFDVLIVEKGSVWYKARAVFAKSSNERAINWEIVEKWPFGRARFP